MEILTIVILTMSSLSQQQTFLRPTIDYLACSGSMELIYSGINFTLYSGITSLIFIQWYNIFIQWSKVSGLKKRVWNVISFVIALT